MISGISFPTKNPEWIQDVKTFENLTGHNHDVLIIFSQFDYRPFMVAPYFYTKPMEVFKLGKTPMITWYPTTSNVCTTPADICQQISDGKFNDYILSVTNCLKRFILETGSKVYLRLGHEMNIASRPYAKPKEFIEMWKYIHQFMKRVLGDKLEFIWCPNNNDIGHVVFEDFFPGDDFIDWVGVDGYNWGGHGEWQTFGEVFEPSLKRLNLISKKPVAICEWGSTAKSWDIYDYFKKSSWISESFEWLKNNSEKFNIKMNCYYNINANKQDIDSAIFTTKENIINDRYLDSEYKQFKTLKNIERFYK